MTSPIGTDDWPVDTSFVANVHASNFKVSLFMSFLGINPKTFKYFDKDGYDKQLHPFEKEKREWHSTLGMPSILLQEKISSTLESCSR